MKLLILTFAIAVLLGTFLLILKIIPKPFSFRRDRVLPIWVDDISSISSNHTQVAGVLAGFTITVLFLIVGVRYSNQKDLNENEIIFFGLFLVSFFSYIATGISYSLVLELEKIRQFFSFTISSLLYCFSLVLSFVALTLLVKELNYKALFIPALIMTSGTIIGSFLALSIPMDLLLFIRLRFLFVILFASLLSGLLIFLLTSNYLINITALFSIITLSIIFFFSRTMLIFFPSQRFKNIIE